MGLVLHRRCIDMVAFSAGSTTLLSSSGDQNIRVLKFFARWEAKVRAFFGSVEAKDAHRDALSEGRKEVEAALCAGLRADQMNFFRHSES